MKIENVETHLIRLPYTTGGQKNWGNIKWSTLDYVMIRIDTDAGISGWGDGFGYGAAFATKAAVDHIVGPLLIGEDARDIAGIISANGHVMGMMPHPERAISTELGSADGATILTASLEALVS